MADTYFPTTRWSVLDRLAAGEPNPSGPELDDLLRRYYPALKAHLVIDHGVAGEAAEDLLQEFVLRKVLERGVLSSADQSRGRFRTFLLAVLDRFVIDQSRRGAVRRKRMPLRALDESA